MSFDFSTILGNPFLLAMALTALLSWPVLGWLCWRSGLAEWNMGQVRRLFWVWLGLFTLEFWVMGPASFIAWDCEGNFGVAMIQYLASHPTGGWFAHAFSGGIDLALFFPGMQYVNQDVLLARIAPTWVWIAVHKMTVASVGFWGAWLLARPSLPGRPGVAAAVALLFPVSHIYLQNYSTEFGTGFAMIPLAVWAALVQPADRLFWPRALGVAALLALAEPMKVFPPLAVALVGAAILVGVRDWRRALGAFALQVGLSLLNWHEVLYGLALGTGLTSRVNMITSQPDVLGTLFVGLDFFWQTLPLSGAEFVLALGLLLWRDRRQAVRVGLAMAWVVGSFTALASIDWSVIGLRLLNALSHNYTRLALPALAPLALAPALALVPARPLGRLTAAVAGAGLALLVWGKLGNLGQWLWFGGQAAFTTHRTLAERDWRPAEPFRVVTLFDNPHPNVTAAFYGLETFDGGSNLDPAAYSQTWFAAMGRRAEYQRTTRTRIDWRYWDGRAYHVGDHVRLDILRLANVRFLASGLPLAGEGLRLVRAPPAGDEFTRVRPDFFPSTAAYLRERLHRMTEAGDLWIYELEGALPRFYPATGVEAVADDGQGALLERAVVAAPAGTVVVTPESAARLGSARPLSITGGAECPDGYDLSVSAPEGGIVVVNQTYIRFWEAETADGARLAVEPADGAHMAVAVPAGSSSIRLRYRRPTVAGLVMGHVAPYTDRR